MGGINRWEGEDFRFMKALLHTAVCRTKSLEAGVAKVDKLCGDWRPEWEKLNSGRSLEEELRKRFAPTKARCERKNCEGIQKYQPLVDNVLFEQTPFSFSDVLAIIEEASLTDVRIHKLYMFRTFYDAACTQPRGIKIGKTMRSTGWRNKQLRESAKKIGVFIEKCQFAPFEIIVGEDEVLTEQLEEVLKGMMARVGGIVIPNSHEYFEIDYYKAIEVLFEFKGNTQSWL